MKRFAVSLVLLGACASAVAAQPKDSPPPRPAPIPRTTAPAPPRVFAPRYGAPANTSVGRPTAIAPSYPREDRGYGRERSQGYAQGGYDRPPQVRPPQVRPEASGADAPRGRDQRNPGATPSNGFRGRPYDDRGYGGTSARGYGNAQRYRPRFAPYRYPNGYGYRAFHRGDGFPRALLISDYILFDYAAFNLAPPPRSNYEWVRYGPDAVLVDTYSGRIVDVDYGVFAAPVDAYADGGDYPPGDGGPASYAPWGADGYDAPTYPTAARLGIRVTEPIPPTAAEAIALRVRAVSLVLILTAALAARLERAAAQYRERDARAGRGMRVDDGRYGFAGYPREAPAPYARDPRHYGYGSYDASRGWSRGQYLPPDYRGASVANPSRYHLRAPPAGYGWVGDGRNAYLMQRSTGMVLDLVPRAYERPVAPRPRR